MKLKISNSHYEELKEKGDRVIAYAINDDVSTTRKSVGRKVHTYEHRFSVMKAFMKASKSKIVTVTANYEWSAKKARVLSLGEVTQQGLTFTLELEYVKEAV